VFEIFPIGANPFPVVKGLQAASLKSISVVKM